MCAAPHTPQHEGAPHSDRDRSATVRAAQVLLEHIMMLELIARGEVKGIYPVMAGERKADGRYASFFEGRATVSLPPVRVAAVGEKLSHHLRRAKKGEPQSREATSATVPRVCAGLLRSL